MKIPLSLGTIKREEGQGLVEYALALVLIAVVVIIILTVLGTQVSATFARVIGGLNGQTITGSGTEAVVSGFDVNVTQNVPPTSCTVSITGITGFSFVEGQLEGGVGLSGSTSYTSISATSGSDGTLSIGSGGSNGSATCSGSVSVTLGGNTKTVNYSE